MSAKKDVHFSSPQFLEKIKNRDTEAISSLVKTYTEPLFRASLGLGFDQQNSEELVQRVWFTFCDVADKFQGRSHIRTFLFGILYNKSSELRREYIKIQKTDPIEETIESRFSESGHWIKPPINPEEFLHKTQTLEVINCCLTSLPLSQKLAFCLKEIEGEKSENICKILEVTSTNLGVLLYRARNRLRECIEKNNNRV